MGKKLKQPKPSNLRAIPAVGLPRHAVLAIVRREHANLRSSVEIPEFDSVLRTIQAKLDQFAQTRIQSVINGTGIVVHTNLGRSPLAAPVVETLKEIAINY